MKWKKYLVQNSYVSPDGCRVLDDRDATKIATISNLEGFILGINVALLIVTDEHDKDYLLRKKERIEVKLKELIDHELKGNAYDHILS